jgi:hypothetical protein
MNISMDFSISLHKILSFEIFIDLDIFINHIINVQAAKVLLYISARHYNIYHIQNSVQVISLPSLTFWQFVLSS